MCEDKCKKQTKKATNLYKYIKLFILNKNKQTNNYNLILPSLVEILCILNYSLYIKIIYIYICVILLFIFNCYKYLNFFLNNNNNNEQN